MESIWAGSLEGWQSTNKCNDPTGGSNCPCTRAVGGLLVTASRVQSCSRLKLRRNPICRSTILIHQVAIVSVEGRGPELLIGLVHVSVQCAGKPGREGHKCGPFRSRWPDTPNAVEETAVRDLPPTKMGQAAPTTPSLVDHAPTVLANHVIYAVLQR